MSAYVVLLAPASTRGVRVCDEGSLDMAALFVAGTDFAVFHRRDDADIHLLRYVAQESQVGVDAPPVAPTVGSSSEPPVSDNHSADLLERELRRRQLYRETIPESPPATKTIIARRIDAASTDIFSTTPHDAHEAFNAADDPAIPIVEPATVLPAAASLAIASPGGFSAEDVAATSATEEFADAYSPVEDFDDAYAPTPHYAGLFADPHYSTSPASRTSSSLFTSATFLQFCTCATGALGPCLAHALLLGDPADPTANVALIRQNRRLLRRAANDTASRRPSPASPRHRHR